MEDMAVEPCMTQYQLILVVVYHFVVVCMSDILFSTLERWQGNRSWGKFLDAGTGVHSLQWIQRLDTELWDAITADYGMQRQIESNASVCLRPQDRVLVGNWMDDSFCAALGKYDTILADYLIGAVDGFSPYAQDIILKRLTNHLLPGGRIYIIGMSPIPDSVVPPTSIVSEVRRARDACILLAGHRPYREFPLDWMQRHLAQSGLRVIDTKNYSILHSVETINRQVAVAESKLPLIGHVELNQGMQKYLLDLRRRVEGAVATTTERRIPLSYDYCIVAEMEMKSAPAAEVGLDDIGVLQPAKCSEDSA